MDMGAAAVAEDSMVDTLAVVIEVGTLEGSMVEAGEAIMADIMVGFVEDTMAVTEVVTMVGTMVEVFTHIGDYGDGDFGDGLFWDGPMQVGPTCHMEDIRI